MADQADQRRQAVAMNEAAAAQWASAMREHVMAPPDPGFPQRLRSLAEAARSRARAARVADTAGLRWVARPGAVRSQPPYELRPGTGRTGPAKLWERFDEAVGGYNRAIAGTDARAVGDAADVLADVAQAIADALDSGKTERRAADEAASAHAR